MKQEPRKWMFLAGLLCCAILANCGGKGGGDAKGSKAPTSPPLSALEGGAKKGPAGPNAPGAMNEPKQGKRLSAPGEAKGGSGEDKGGAADAKAAAGGPVSGKVAFGLPSGGWETDAAGKVTREEGSANLLISSSKGEYRVTFPAGALDKKDAQGQWQTLPVSEAVQRNSGSMIVIKSGDMRLRLTLDQPYPPAAAALSGLKQRNT